MQFWVQIVALLAAYSAGTEAAQQCVVEGTTMSCQNKGLTQPPAGYWPNIEMLELDQNDITILYEHAFSGFPNLKKLSVSMTGLTELSFDAFADTQNLEQLSVAYNNITTVLPASEGVVFKELWAIFLLMNKITTLDPDAFLCAPNLRVLYLSFNPLVVPDGVSLMNHPKLLQLEVSWTGPLGHVSFSGVPAVTILSAMEAGITNITGSFVNNRHLVQLVLGGNKIREVTKGTFTSSGLVLRLSLSMNPLTRLDVSALNGVVPKHGLVDITYTPLGCACGYEALYWWAIANDVNLHGECDEEAQPCDFSRRRERGLLPPGDLAPAGSAFPWKDAVRKWRTK